MISSESLQTKSSIERTEVQECGHYGMSKGYCVHTSGANKSNRLYRPGEVYHYTYSHTAGSSGNQERRHLCSTVGEEGAKCSICRHRQDSYNFSVQQNMKLLSRGGIGARGSGGDVNILALKTAVNTRVPLAQRTTPIQAQGLKKTIRDTQIDAGTAEGLVANSAVDSQQIHSYFIRQRYKGDTEYTAQYGRANDGALVTTDDENSLMTLNSVRHAKDVPPRASEEMPGYKKESLKDDADNGEAREAKQREAIFKMSLGGESSRQHTTTTQAMSQEYAFTANNGVNNFYSNARKLEAAEERRQLEGNRSNKQIPLSSRPVMSAGTESLNASVNENRPSTTLDATFNKLNKVRSLPYAVRGSGAGTTPSHIQIVRRNIDPQLQPPQTTYIIPPRRYHGDGSAMVLGKGGVSFQLTAAAAAEVARIQQDEEEEAGERASDSSQDDKLKRPRRRFYNVFPHGKPTHTDGGYLHLPQPSGYDVDFQHVDHKTHAAYRVMRNAAVINDHETDDDDDGPQHEGELTSVRALHAGGENIPVNRANPNKIDPFLVRNARTGDMAEHFYTNNNAFTNRLGVDRALCEVSTSAPLLEGTSKGREDVSSGFVGFCPAEYRNVAKINGPHAEVLRPFSKCFVTVTKPKKTAARRAAATAAAMQATSDELESMSRGGQNRHPRPPGLCALQRLPTTQATTVVENKTKFVSKLLHRKGMEGMLSSQIQTVRSLGSGSPSVNAGTLVCRKHHHTVMKASPTVTATS